MNIVFCTTCKGRAQHILRTLPQHFDHNRGFDRFKVVLLDYNSPDRLQEYVETNYFPMINQGKLVVYHHRDPGPFQMSHSKNMCHRLGIFEGADVLVNMDADNWAAPGFARWVEEQFAAGAEFLWTNAKSVCGRARQGLAGRIALSKKLFLKVGGYDERFIVWAPEDEDLKCRVRRLGYEGLPVPDRFLYVIPHKDGLRFKEYPHAKPTVESEAAALKQVRESTATIANFGNFGCGTVYRNYGSETVTLKPLPTRIFGIGMHKTGTTSLHTALRILGIESAHWTGPGWAKQIWTEFEAAGRSLTLEREYAMSDLPFTLLYKQLDAAYPGSKFILTLRSEHSWLESVRNHWDFKANPWRHTWDQDWFTHRIHNILYGRKSFHAETMLARYRRHNAEVLEYFKDRPQDLLVMDMDRGAGWRELCGFLRVAKPKEHYPKAFVTRKEP